MKKEELKTMLENYDLGITPASEIIDTFISINDAPTMNTPQVNDISSAVVQEREKLLAPLANRCAQLLELLAK